MDKPALSSIEDILADARAGKMFILVDDENRENEGDLIIPAQHATAEAINFMATHGRGLICLAMERKRIEHLGLSLMSPRNQTRHSTAFTVSIEAREGVTTGISAADRARTIQVAIDPAKGAGDIISPGHVFPLIAKDGGVLERAGHTEAAVDIARAAGLNPAGVICEIMKDDGSMARLPDLLAFGKKHSLKIGTIADLIAWRLAREKLVERVAERPFTSRFGGAFTLYAYRDRQEGVEHVALVKGAITGKKPLLVRMHALDILHDVLGGEAGEKASTLHHAMEILDKEGAGALVLLRGMPRPVSHAAPPPPELRHYGIGAQILVDLGVTEMTLLTNTPKHIVGLEGYGLKVTGHRPLNGG